MREPRKGDYRWCKKWSATETQFLRDNYSRLSVPAIAQQLGRSEKGARGKLERLGVRLATLKRNRQWTADELQIIKDNIDKPIGELERLLSGRSYSAIYAQYALLGGKNKRKGYHFTSDGRKIVYTGHGLGGVAEHRLVVENHLGRKLSRSETVHHVDLDKGNNQLENLHLFPNASEHLLSHRALEKLIKPLLERGVIRFNRDSGRYELC